MAGRNAAGLAVLRELARGRCERTRPGLCPRTPAATTPRRTVRAVGAPGSLAGGPAPRFALSQARRAYRFEWFIRPDKLEHLFEFVRSMHDVDFAGYRRCCLERVRTTSRCTSRSRHCCCRWQPRPATSRLLVRRLSIPTRTCGIRRRVGSRLIVEVGFDAPPFRRLLEGYHQLHPAPADRPRNRHDVVVGDISANN
jgi:hypothetical protein